MADEEKTPAYKPYQVPYALYLQLEEQAMIMRKDTGAEVRWTDICKAYLEKGLQTTNKETVQ